MPPSITVRYDEEAARWRVSESPPGPAGVVVLNLAPSVLLRVDRADPSRVVDLSFPAAPPSVSLRPAHGTLMLVRSLFGRDAASFLTESEALEDGALDAGREVSTDPARSSSFDAATRLALLSSVRDDGGIGQTLWSAEAAELALQVGHLDSFVQAQAEAGAEGLRRLETEEINRLPLAEKSRVAEVATAVVTVVGNTDERINSLAALAQEGWYEWWRPWSDVDLEALRQWFHLPPIQVNSGLPLLSDDNEELRRSDPIFEAEVPPGRLAGSAGLVAVGMLLRINWNLDSGVCKVSGHLASTSDDLWLRAIDYASGRVIAAASLIGSADDFASGIWIPPDVKPSTVALEFVGREDEPSLPAAWRDSKFAVSLGVEAADAERHLRMAEASAYWIASAKTWQERMQDAERAALAYACAARAAGMAQRSDSGGASATTAEQSQAEAVGLASGWAREYVKKPGPSPRPYLQEVVRSFSGGSVRVRVT